MVFPFPTEVISEGDVNVIVPKLQAFKKKPSDYAPSKAPVFFNPVMSLNRDLAVLTLQTFQRRVNRNLIVCAPLAGCGIRGLRLAKEISGLEKVILNDINKLAYDLMISNVGMNNLSSIIDVENLDANLLLSTFAAPKSRLDYIDVDPFGSPVLYFDSSLRALRNGGLIALTATDLAPLCGVHPKACLRKYGGRPLRTEYCHELAIRLLASAFVRSAVKHDIGVKFVFSHSSEHYIRLYSIINYGARKADASLGNIGYINHCFSCFHRDITSKYIDSGRSMCPHCGAEMKTAGPLWIGKISDENFIECMLSEKISSATHIRKILELVKKEVIFPPTYFVLDRLCDKLNLPVPPMRDVISELRDREYKICRTHFHGCGIKTDAPASVISETVVMLSNKKN